MYTFRKQRSERSHNHLDGRHWSLARVPEDVPPARVARYRHALRWIAAAVGAVIIFEAYALLRWRG